MDREVLDQPIWHAMNGPQSRFVIGDGAVPAVSARCSPVRRHGHAVGGQSGHLGRNAAGRRRSGVVHDRTRRAPPSGLELSRAIKLSQMVARSVAPVGDDIEMVRLDTRDVPAMLELVALTQPGPFAPRTIELGQYLGIRDKGQLRFGDDGRAAAAGWPATPRSARSARTRTIADELTARRWFPASPAPSPPVARRRSCTSFRRTPRRLRPTRRSALSSAA